jgi:hypothetical protein
VSFAVLILVSSLTYSVVYLLSQNPNALELGSKYPKHIDCLSTLPFVSLWMFEQNGLQSLKELKAKPIKRF